jgi:hypothetical protein
LLPCLFEETTQVINLPDLLPQVWNVVAVFPHPSAKKLAVAWSWSMSNAEIYLLRRVHELRSFDSQAFGIRIIILPNFWLFGRPVRPDTLFLFQGDICTRSQ